MTHGQKNKDPKSAYKDNYYGSRALKKKTTKDRPEPPVPPPDSDVSSQDSDETSDSSKTNFFSSNVLTVITGIAIPVIVEIFSSFSLRITSPTGFIIGVAVIIICILIICLCSLSVKNKNEEYNRELARIKREKEYYSELMSSPDCTYPQHKHYEDNFNHYDEQQKKLQHHFRSRQLRSSIIDGFCCLSLTFAVFPIIIGILTLASERMNPSTQSASSPEVPVMSATVYAPSPTPAADETNIPTFTPKPVDSAQNLFDQYWNDYFGDCYISTNCSFDDARDSARSFIESAWLDEGFRSSVSYWPIEEIEIYNQENTCSIYAKSTDKENELRQNNTNDNLLLAGTTYIETTSNHINQAFSNNTVLLERDLGVACLRGADLLIRFIRNQNGDSPVIGKAYYRIACLLQHCADYVYNETGNRAYILYTFSYVCYEKACQYGYNKQIINDNLTVLNDSMRNALF